MKRLRHLLGWVVLGAGGALRADDFFDRVEETLTVSAFDTAVRARISGTAEFEGYRVEQPPPGLIYTDGKTLFRPRLSLFLDAQLGARVYAFVQSRWDQGFDPSETGKGQVRLDEYAVRAVSIAGRQICHGRGQLGAPPR